MARRRDVTISETAQGESLIFFKELLLVINDLLENFIERTRSLHRGATVFDRGSAPVLYLSSKPGKRKHLSKVLSVEQNLYNQTYWLGLISERIQALGLLLSPMRDQDTARPISAVRVPEIVHWRVTSPCFANQSILLHSGW